MSRSTSTSGVCPIVGAFLSSLPKSAATTHDAILVTVEKLLSKHDTHFSGGTTLCTGADAGAIFEHPNTIKPDDAHPFDKSCTQALDILCAAGATYADLKAKHPFSQTQPDGTPWVEFWCDKNYPYFVETIDKIIDAEVHRGDWCVWQKVVEKCYYNGFTMMIYGKAPEEMPGFVQYEEYRTFVEWVDLFGKFSMNKAVPPPEMMKKGAATRAKLEVGLGKMWEDAKANQGANLRPDTFLHKLASDPKLRDAHTHAEVVAMLISMWWSGNFSASVGCSNTVYGLYLLGLKDNGATCKKLRQEVDKAKSYQDLRNSDTLDTVCCESLRWRSPVLGTFRRVVENPGPKLHGRVLPFGHNIMLTPRGCQADKAYWGKDVAQFNPSRWTTAKKQECPLTSHGPHYWPFGFGERKCIGRDMAKFFMKAVVSQVVKKTEFQFKGKWDQWILFGTSQPLKIRARFVRRGGKLPAIGMQNNKTRLVGFGILGAMVAVVAARHYELPSLRPYVLSWHSTMESMRLFCSQAVESTLTILPYTRICQHKMMPALPVFTFVGAVSLAACMARHTLARAWVRRAKRNVRGYETLEELTGYVNNKISEFPAIASRIGMGKVNETIEQIHSRKEYIQAMSCLDNTTELFLLISYSTTTPPRSVHDIVPLPKGALTPLGEKSMSLDPMHSDKSSLVWLKYPNDRRALFFDDRLTIGLPLLGEAWGGGNPSIGKFISWCNADFGFPEMLHTETSERGAIKNDGDMLKAMIYGQAVLGNKLPEPNIQHQELSSDAAQTQLAFHGPGVLFLESSDDPRLGTYVANTLVLTNFPVRAGFEKMGAAAYFDDNRKITHVITARGTFKPGDELWEHAKYVWRCSCMTFMTAWHHLTHTHWIVSNAVSSSVFTLPPGHPVRRCLKVNTFGTCQINYNSTIALYPEFGFLHKLSPFQYSSLKTIFYRAAGAWKFQTWPEYVDSVNLPKAVKDELPFFKDGLAAWKVLHKYITSYLDLYYKDDAAVQSDMGVREYWKFTLVPQYQQGLPPLSKAALANQMTHFVWTVTGYHEFVGSLMPYVSSPAGMFYSVRKTTPPQTRCDLHHYIGTLCLTSATGGRMPQYTTDWSHLLDTKAKSWQAELVEALKDLTKKQTDPTKFCDFDPSRWECSVSV